MTVLCPFWIIISLRRVCNASGYTKTYIYADLIEQSSVICTWAWNEAETETTCFYYAKSKYLYEP